jgi:hypothetical protein
MLENHLSFAHRCWERLIQPGDAVIDATSGNGHDTVFLAELVVCKNSGLVIGLDIQENAIANTQSRLNKKFTKSQLDRVHLFQLSHAAFPEIAYQQPIKLIIYNLGYLPGGNKELTTLSETTLQSLQCAMEIISPLGSISITCYPGHEQGAIEEKDLLDLVSRLDPQEWNVTRHQWINRQKAPNLLILTRKIK